MITFNLPNADQNIKEKILEFLMYKKFDLKLKLPKNDWQYLNAEFERRISSFTSKSFGKNLYKNLFLG